MNLPLILAIITASGILLTSPLLPFQAIEIYADESETNTEQGLSQENIGSGDSINFNCGENSIDTSASVICGTGIETGGVGGGGGFTVTVRNCVDTGGNSVSCAVVAPSFLTGSINCSGSGVASCIFPGSVFSGTFFCDRPTVGPGTQDIQCVAF